MMISRLMVVGTALMLVACAPAGDTGTETTVNSTSSTTAITTTTSTTSPPIAFAADLAIVIGTADHPAEFEATLRCGPDIAATGYLAASASMACDYLNTSEEAQTLLLEGAEPNRACAEIFGGGEVATITGTLTATPVDLAVDRANGCGISDWGVLQPLLVEPYDLERQNAAASCSGANRPSDNLDTGELPPLVSEVRAALLAGAATCDLDGLAAQALADGTNVSFGGSDDPAGLWQDLESTGDTPMADLITVLQMAPGTTDDGQGTVFWVWPKVAVLDDWSDATAEQRAELAGLFGTDALAGWDSFGGYIGYRVGITESGRWAFFVAGD